MHDYMAWVFKSQSGHLPQKMRGTRARQASGDARPAWKTVIRRTAMPSGSR
jgi:hypothetical protein